MKSSKCDLEALRKSQKSHLTALVSLCSLQCAWKLWGMPTCLEPKNRRDDGDTINMTITLQACVVCLLPPGSLEGFNALSPICARNRIALALILTITHNQQQIMMMSSLVAERTYDTYRVYHVTVDIRSARRYLKALSKQIRIRCYDTRQDSKSSQSRK